MLIILRLGHSRRGRVVMERLVGQEGAPGTTGMDHRHSHTPLAARELRTKDTLAEAIAVIQVRVQEGEQRDGLEAAGAVFMLLLEQPQVVPGEADRAQVLLELTEPLILVQAAVVSARTRLLRQQGQEDQASLLCEWQLMIIPVRNQEEQ